MDTSGVLARVSLRCYRCRSGNAISVYRRRDRNIPQTGEPATRHVAAVARAVGVLDVLAASAVDLGTNEIARRAEVNPSTASRVLATLADGGLVQYMAATGRYRLGLRMFELGTAAVARVDLQGVARIHLRALADATGETATLSVPGDGAVMTVDFASGGASVQSVAHIGRPSVLHATAIGKVYLACGGRLPAGSLAACTERTITDRGVLAVEVDRVRERGHARSVGEREPDLNAVAAPIRGRDDALIAILGLQGPAGRFDRRAMRTAVPTLVERAGAIGRGAVS